VLLIDVEHLGDLRGSDIPALILGAPPDVTVLTAAVNAGARGVVDWPTCGAQGVREAVEGLMPRPRAIIGHADFQVRLEQESQRALRGGNGLSLILFDIDDFRAINERDGYAAGDALIERVGDLLESGDRDFKLRGCDLPAHLGSDAFALILPDTARRGAAVVANRLRLACERATGTEFTISIGVASIPKNARSRRDLIDVAACALGAAKKRGRNRVVTYTPALKTGPTAFEAAVVEADLLLALDELIDGAQVRPAFQPIVRPDRSVFAHEVLCRPQHHKFPSPWHLFTLAERAGRVAEVGRVVREKAFAHMGELPEDVNMFVNLHPLEVNRDLIAEVKVGLADWPGRVVFEVTEAAEVRDVKAFRMLVDELREQGFQIALDDLGAGYAGLNSLSDLAPEYIKLDMELVRRARADQSTQRLVRHMLEFAEGEGMTIVAEGVETREEVDMVNELGCPLLQGYYFAKPGPPFPEIAPEA
jgi:diguanylate cyclase (GGDEF)-like protein